MKSFSLVELHFSFLIYSKDTFLALPETMSDYRISFFDISFLLELDYLLQNFVKVILIPAYTLFLK